MALDLFVQDDNNFILDVPADDSDLHVGQPVVMQPVNDYEDLIHKPSINEVELVGDKTFEDLGLVPATSEHDGLMSAEDKTALDAIPLEIENIQDELDSKQDELTFDSTPTAGSSNPVTSNGIYEFYENKTYLKCVGYWNWLTPSQSRATLEFINGTSLEEAVKQPIQVYGSMNDGTPEYMGQALLQINELLSDYIVVFPQSIQWIVFLYAIKCGGARFSYSSVSHTFTFKSFIDGTELKENKVSAIPVQDVDMDVNRYPNVWAIRNLFDGLQSVMESEASASKTLVDLELNHDGNLVPTFEDISFPVQSVNGKTGTVSLDAADVGALPDTTPIPVKTSDLNNDSGYVDATQAANAAPVQSVNGQTGAVSLGANDVGALPDTTSIPTKTSDLQNDGSDGTSTYVETDDLPEVHNIPAGGNAGQILKKISATDYDVHWADQTQYYPSGYSTTGADKQTKQIACSSWTATAKSYLHILLTHANTYAGKIYFTVNAVNTYEVWINGAVSSATNYSLPAGTYIIYFDGSAFQVRTDGIIPASVNGTAARIPYGECDSTSTSTAFTATVPGITELKDGVTMLLYNGVVTSASGFTINVNGLGAKPSYNNMTLGNPVTPTNPTRDTTIFNINYAFLFVYSETIVSGGCWIGYRGYDANTNPIGYQLRTNNTTMKASDKFYRYRLLFTSADGTQWVPANTSTSTNATSTRTPNTRAIDPFGEIVWYGTTTAIEANANVTAGQLWQEYYSSYTNIGYSFNNTGAAQTMTANLPIYIKCTPQADGSAIIDPTTPYTQTLPSTDDGKIYIYLGRAYNATNFEITMNHPVYYHDGTGIRIWCGGRLMPNPPSTDGTYTLQCTVSSGVATYNWI